jgi:YebC/PmpR family DNA-binding regulatory protein
MSGHSHWATIRHKKAAVDAKRGKLFSKLARAIMVAAKSGGGDPSMNLTLRYAIDTALAANMTRDAVERAIKKGTGEVEGVTYEQITYEGYGPGGVAVLVETMTDNRNRTASEMRKMFELRGGNLGGAGSVAWNFQKKGLITVKAEKIDEDALMERVIDAGAEDLSNNSGTYEITCEVAHFEAVKKALADAGIAANSAELTSLPKQAVTIGDPALARRILHFMEQLDDHDDVQNVYANFDIPQEVMAQLEG